MPAIVRTVDGERDRRCRVGRGAGLRMGRPARSGSPARPGPGGPSDGLDPSCRSPRRHARCTEWYTDPVGAAAWDDLVAQLDAAGAPFADRLAGQRDELVALEASVRAAGRPADLPSRPVRRQRPAHGHGRAVRDRLGEQWPRRPRPGAGRRARRVRLRRSRSGRQTCTTPTSNTVDRGGSRIPATSPWPSPNSAISVSSLAGAGSTRARTGPGARHESS